MARFHAWTAIDHRANATEILSKIPANSDFTRTTNAAGAVPVHRVGQIGRRYFVK
jgi:hypothetical protein